jgi:hypothetical protein
VAVLRVGGCELSLACSSVTAKSSRSYYIVPMPTNLHRYTALDTPQFWSMKPEARRFVSTKSPDPRRHRGPPVKLPWVGHAARGSLIGKCVGCASPAQAKLKRCTLKSAMDDIAVKLWLLPARRAPARRCSRWLRGFSRLACKSTAPQTA